MHRVLGGLLLALATATATTTTTTVGGPARPLPGPRAHQAAPAAVVAYRPPVSGALDVASPFDPPRTRYGAGHLGVDLRVPWRSPVLAAAAGTVTFAGSVAGHGVVVVLHADGIRTEYEPLSVTVHAGERVTAGAVLGRVRGTHGSCAPGRCLHWGARRGTAYLDPLSLLQPLGPVRLLPWPR